MNIVEEITRFKSYCNDFYNIKYGVYPIAETDVINSKVDEYILKPREVKIEFDSYDREQVRELIGR